MRHRRNPRHPPDRKIREGVRTLLATGDVSVIPPEAAQALANLLASRGFSPDVLHHQEIWLGYNEETYERYRIDPPVLLDVRPGADGLFIGAAGYGKSAPGVVDVVHRNGQLTAWVWPGTGWRVDQTGGWDEPVVIPITPDNP